MPNWLASMQQTFEYYKVDPVTWRDISEVRSITSCSIERDSSVETLGDASFESTEDLGECYIRVYLVIIQNGIKERVCLGTFIAQTPSLSFDGKYKQYSIQAYTPLLELGENKTPIGYYVPKDSNIMDTVYSLASDHMRSPIVKTNKDTLITYDFVADNGSSWLTYISDLASRAEFELSLDETSRLLFSPMQELDALQPVYTFDDSNSSILYPEITFDNDIYGIPNVIEVIYSDNGTVYTSRIVNDDPNSPLSTVNRGREIIYIDTAPSLNGAPTSQREIDEYAETMLKSLSSIQCKLQYSHGYCGVRVGDCVRLNYEKAGLVDVKAKVISQSIECRPGVAVSEIAVFTKRLWR